MPLDRKRRQKFRKASLVEISGAVNPVQGKALVTIVKDRKEDDMPESKDKNPAAELEAVSKERDALKEKVEGLEKQVADMTAAKEAADKAAKEAEAKAKETAEKADKEAKEAAAKAAQAEKDDAVVYTDGDGNEYTAKDDPRLVALAKKADAERETRVDSELTARASEFKSISKDVEVTKATLRSLDAIKDKDMREKALDLLRNSVKAHAKAFETTGSAESPKSDKDKNLSVRVEEIKKEKGVTDAVAWRMAYNEREKD